MMTGIPGARLKKSYGLCDPAGKGLFPHLSVEGNICYTLNQMS